jgi:hypothetical protein
MPTPQIRPLFAVAYASLKLRSPSEDNELLTLSSPPAPSGPTDRDRIAPAA